MGSPSKPANSGNFDDYLDSPDMVDELNAFDGDDDVLDEIDDSYYDEAEEDYRITLGREEIPGADFVEAPWWDSFF